jgi:hypothetical protein
MDLLLIKQEIEQHLGLTVTQAARFWAALNQSQRAQASLPVPRGPSVTVTPRPGGPIPVPYPNVAMSPDPPSQTVTDTITIARTIISQPDSAEHVRGSWLALKGSLAFYPGGRATLSHDVMTAVCRKDSDSP